MEYSNEAITTVWGVSLAIGVVVIVVVAWLLKLIINTSLKIENATKEIWTQGKLVANNTIQIPLFLSTTNHVAGQILHNAQEIYKGAKVVESHIEGCPGCPACILSNK